MSYAAIDCGTNSTRLLVHDGTRTIERLMRITRLGQGVDDSGMLNPDAIERTLAVLREYRGVLDRHGVTRVRMTATSAARDAANRDAFFTVAREGVELADSLGLQALNRDVVIRVRAGRNDTGRIDVAAHDDCAVEGGLERWSRNGRTVEVARDRHLKDDALRFERPVVGFTDVELANGEDRIGVGITADVPVAIMDRAGNGYVQ